MESVRRLVSWGFRRLVSYCGFDLSPGTEDRLVLENAIFPYFLERDEFSNILFVGCHWYTRRYNKIFRDKTYWTLEIDPEKSQYGAKRHVVDSMENLRTHFDEGELDLILCNGVFGWGLNEPNAVEKAFQECFECLRDGGVLVIGWNDIPKRCPFPLEEIQALKQFHPFVFPPLSAAEYLTSGSGRHTYGFYVKHPDIQS
ncbi:MAG: class I SAM-dependent methyltransferase [Acidobacteriota bacterium]